MSINSLLEDGETKVQRGKTTCLRSHTGLSHYIQVSWLLTESFLVYSAATLGSWEAGPGLGECAREEKKATVCHTVLS